MRIYERKNILERNINYSNAYGRNLLQEAIVSCENTIAVDLVNKGIDINHQDKGELVANCNRFNSLKHSAVRSYAFTEQGVAMLSSVLRSETAIRVSIRIMDAFVAMRRFMVTNAEVFQRLSTMEYHQLEIQQHQQETDKRIEEVFRRLDKGNAKPKQGVFYNGQIYDAYTFVSGLIKSAKKRIVLIDNYVDETVLTLVERKSHTFRSI